MDRVAAVVLLSLCTILSSFGPSAALAQPADAAIPARATIVVPTDFATIQAAIDGAANGDLILVQANTYAENLVINKPLSVESVSGSVTTVLDVASTSTAAVRITVDGVSLNGFTVRGGSYGLDVDASVTVIDIQDCVLEQSASRHARIPAAVVNECMSGLTLVAHASGANNAIQLFWGTITESATWPVPPTGFVYLLEDRSGTSVYNPITIAGAANPTLTLLPGTIVKTRFESGFRVGNSGLPGQLIADDVIFTSYRDDSVGGDSYGDGASTGAADQWDRIEINSTGDATFTNCTFRYGGRLNVGMFRTLDSNPTLSGCSFSTSGSDGIRCEGTSAPTITASTVADNLYGLRLADTSSADLIGGNTFEPQTSRTVILNPTSVAALVSNNTFVANPSGANNTIQLSWGTITESATWPVPPTGFVYLLEDPSGSSVYYPITIAGAANPTLTLLPGTIVKTRFESGFRVGNGGLPGQLIADGVTFTSYRDDSVGGDSYGDGATTGATDQWDRIEINSTGDATFTNCTFRYGGRLNVGMLRVLDASPVFTNCSIRQSGNDGLRCEGASAPTITGSTFADNLFALRLEASTSADLISGNTFEPQTSRTVILNLTCVDNLVSNNTFVANPSGANNAIQLIWGTITESATWPVPPTGFVYLLEDPSGTDNYYPVTIAGATNPTLTLLPGTIVKTRLESGFRVGNSGLPGQLIADDVIFTSYRDDAVGGDSYGDGATTGAADQWDRIEIQSTGDATFTNCTFRYGGRLNHGMVWIRDASPTLDGCSFSTSGSDGLRCEGASAPTITGSTFADNLRALQLEDTTSADLISGNTFEPQTSRPVVIHPNCVVTLVNNNTFVANPSGANNAIQLIWGTITESATWPVPPAGFVYLLEDPSGTDNYYPVTIAGATNPTLTLLPGTVVKTRLDSGFRVGNGGLPGQLIADDVIFTSYRDDSVGGDSYGDGATTGAADQWDRIEIQSTGDATFTNCNFRYGGRLNTGMLRILDSNPTLSGCSFSTSGSDGIRCEGTSAPTITGSTFADNLRALQLEDTSSADLISGNTFEPQTSRPVVIHPSCVVTLVNNNTFVANPSGANNAIQLIWGTITESATWPVPPAGFVYLLEDPSGTDNYYPVTIAGATNPTLTLLPGTVVKARLDSGFRVGNSGLPGQLIADDVIFTSYRDDSVGGDSYGDGATTGAADQWDRIEIQSTGDATFTNCTFRYGGRLNAGMLRTLDSNPALSGCSFSTSGSDGIRCEGSSAPTITGSTFADNLYGLTLLDTSSAEFVSGNTIQPQSSYPLRVNVGAVPDAVANNTLVVRGDQTLNAIQVLDGTLVGNVTWPVPPAGFVYLMTNDNWIRVYGEPAPSLTLQAGTIFKCYLDSGILVGDQTLVGNVVADGVIFTSINDDSIAGDSFGNGATTGTAGQWRFLRFYQGTTGTFTNCEFRYGGYRDETTVRTYTTAITSFDNCLFRDGAGSAIRSEGASPVVTGSTFDNNGYAVRLIEPSTAVGISGNTILPQTTYTAQLCPRTVPDFVGNNTFVAGTDRNSFQLLDGFVEGDVTWPVPPAGFVYLMTDDNWVRVYGDPAPSLTLQAGTIFKSYLDSGILVGDQTLVGSVVADGVVFTSINDDSIAGDSYGNGATTGTAGQWRFLRFYQGTTGTFTNCEFRYGGYRDAATVRVYANSVTSFTNCLFRDGSGAAIRSEGASPVVTGSTFDNNGYAVRLIEPSTAEGISGNTILPQATYTAQLNPRSVPDFVGNNTFVAGADRNSFQLLDGSVVGDVSWPAPPAGFVYLMTDDNWVRVYGDPAPSLTLQAGSIFKLHLDSGILVGDQTLFGSLDADGVVFTSINDDSIAGDSSGNGASVGAPGQWRFLRFYQGTTGTFNDCEFLYGGYRDEGSVLLEGDVDASFTNCWFRDGSSAGIKATSASKPRIIDSRFEANRDGIWTRSNARPQVLNSCFVGNTGFGVRAEDYTDREGSLPVLQCWWGDTSGPSGGYAGTGDAVSENVACEPWLDFPVCDGVTDVPEYLPTDFLVHDAVPNPFNPRTTIAFELPVAETVTLKVYDLRGRAIRTLVAAETRVAGRHEVTWNGADDQGRRVSSGVYLYELRAGAHSATRRMTLLK